jgi:hypothetical protein
MGPLEGHRPCPGKWRAAAAIRRESNKELVRFLQVDHATVGGDQPLADQVWITFPCLNILINNVGGLYQRRWETPTATKPSALPARPVLGRLGLGQLLVDQAQVDDVVAELTVQQTELLAGHQAGWGAAARAGHHGRLLPRRTPVDRSRSRIAAPARAAEGRTARFPRAARPAAAQDAGSPPAV